MISKFPEATSQLPTALKDFKRKSICLFINECSEGVAFIIILKGSNRNKIIGVGWSFNNQLLFIKNFY